MERRRQSSVCGEQHLSVHAPDSYTGELLVASFDESDTHAWSKLILRTTYKIHVKVLIMHNILGAILTFSFVQAFHNHTQCFNPNPTHTLVISFHTRNYFKLHSELCVLPSPCSPPLPATTSQRCTLTR